MLGNGAKGTAAKAAAHDIDGEANHFPGWNFGDAVMPALLVRIGRMRAAGVGQVKHKVHLGGGQRDGGRGNPDIAGGQALTVCLHQGAGVAGVGFKVQHAVGVGIQHGVGAHLLVAGQANHGAVTRGHFELALERGVGHKKHGLRHGAALPLGFLSAELFSLLGYLLGLVITRTGGAVGGGLLAGRHVGIEVGFHPAGFVHAGGVDLKPVFARGVVSAAHKGRAAHIGDLFDRLTGGQAVGNFNQGTLGIAVKQQIALGVHHDGTAYFVAPVVVMRNASQAAFNATQNQGHIFVGFPATLAVDNGSAVGPFAAYIAWGVGIVGADLAVSRVAVDHGIHVAGGHTPKQIGFAQHLERFGALPVGLGDDAHPKALGFQHAPNHRHAKAGVVHVGIACDQNNVAAVPAQFVHLGAAHGQNGRRAKAGRPVLAVAGQRLGSARKKGDVNRGVHGQA